MTRMISNSFIEDLKSGVLYEILKYVRSDATLEMEFRKNSINIYYRGGSLIKVREISPNEYNAYFDKNYISSKDSESVILECIDDIDNEKKTKKLIEAIPRIKKQMDFWMQAKKPNGGEREYQHIVAKENNRGTIGRGSDYFICDIEYAGNFENNETFRFDMVGAKWPSKTSLRKNKDNLGLCLIEMKYGDNSLRSENSSGILKHIEDMYKFLCGDKKVMDLKEEMSEIFKVKSELGLIYPYESTEISFSNEVEVIFIFANHDPESSILKDELLKLENNEIYKKLSKIANIKVATSSFMGYGLYENHMISMDEIIRRMKY